jgi:hypothetical protein
MVKVIHEFFAPRGLENYFAILGVGVAEGKLSVEYGVNRRVAMNFGGMRIG